MDSGDWLPTVPVPFFIAGQGLPVEKVTTPPSTACDAFLLLSFGAPEGPGEVMPFLENVTRGKNVPRQQILQVARRYERFDGISPANAQLRALITAVLGQFNARGLQVSVYWGNRNWHPMLQDTLRQMADDGIRHALAMVTSPFESAASYGQYLEEIQLAAKAAGDNAPEIDVLPVFFDQPGFVEATADRVTSALEKITAENRQAARVVYCAHSLPTAMADESPYRQQFEQSCRLVSQRVGLDRWDMAYQSRSGPPSQTWLEPDICRHIEQLAESGKLADLVIVPIGFVYEHLETVFDLDEEAGELCRQSGINMVRAATVGCHPRFVEMIGQLVSQYTSAKNS